MPLKDLSVRLVVIRHAEHRCTEIMDRLTASDQFSRGELQDINRCRIYMRDFFILDIMNIQGT
jgi:hypothetical protein